jgi:hypothetical protein
LYVNFKPAGSLQRKTICKMRTKEEKKRLHQNIKDLTALIEKKQKKIHKLQDEVLFLDNQVLDMLYWFQIDLEEKKL